MSDTQSGVVMSRFRQPTAERATTVAVIADPHIPRQSVETDKLTMPVTFLERAVEDVNERSVDAAVFVGDLTMDGYSAEFDRFDEIVSGLDVPWTAIPGNHDVPKQYDTHDSPIRAEFVQRYTPGELPFVVRHGDVDIIGLDSAFSERVEDTHDGMIGRDQLDWLADQLSSVANPIVAVHHALPPTVAQFDACRDAVAPDINRPPVLQDAESLMETLAAHDAPLVLTGHLHIPTVGVSSPVQEVNSPSTGTYPPAYLVLEIGPQGTVVRYVPVGDRFETRAAFTQRSSYRSKADLFATMAASRVASFPLTDERRSEQSLE